MASSSSDTEAASRAAATSANASALAPTCSRRSPKESRFGSSSDTCRTVVSATDNHSRSRDRRLAAVKLDDTDAEIEHVNVLDSITKQRAVSLVRSAAIVAGEGSVQPNDLCRVTRGQWHGTLTTMPSRGV